MITPRVIAPSEGACTLHEIAIGRVVYYVVPLPVTEWEKRYCLGRSLIRWPAQIERLIDDRPDGRLGLVAITESGAFHAVAPYSEERLAYTWHAAEDPQGEPTSYQRIRVATDEDIALLVQRLTEPHDETPTLIGMPALPNPT